MQRAFGLNIPKTLEDACDPARLALVVYDMQVGIVKQIENGQQITNKVVQVLAAARKAGIRVFFTRHMSTVGRQGATAILISSQLQLATTAVMKNAPTG